MVHAEREVMRSNEERAISCDASPEGRRGLASLLLVASLAALSLASASACSSSDEAGSPATSTGGNATGGSATGGAADGQGGEGGSLRPVYPDGLPYAENVVSFTPGDNAGFNEDEMPEVVLGPPQGLGQSRGSLDVVSLGVAGEIILDFGSRAIVDGEGPDFVVFENAFYAGGDPDAPYAEAGEVSVSNDEGATWHTFPCSAGDESLLGCAGRTPTLEYDPVEVNPIDPELTGGDVFDLAELGVSEAKWVRIRDVATEGNPPSAGFDLDAVGIVHFTE